MSTKTNRSKKKAPIQKKALTSREVQSIQNRLYTMGDWRGLALFRTGIDTMFRVSDTVRICLDEILDHNGNIMDRVSIMMKKTNSPVEVSISRETKKALKKWIEHRPEFSGEWLFPGNTAEGHISEKHYRSLAKEWFKAAGLNPKFYSTHSIRRTKAAELYRQSHNLKAVSLLLGHRDTKVTEEYLGIYREDAVNLASKVKI